MKARTAEASHEVSWHDRRSELLQKACTAIAERMQIGKGLMSTIASIAKEFDNAELGAGRHLSLSAKTLERHWYAWLANGQKSSAFTLNYARNGQRTIVDPLLLRLLIEHSLQTGAGLTEVIGKLNASGAKISLTELQRAFPKCYLRKFERSYRQLTEHRLKLEKDFLAADAKWRRSFFKSRTAALRKFLEKDAVLERRILRQREHLQRKFLKADARAVRGRELLQRQLLERMEVAK